MQTKLKRLAHVTVEDSIVIGGESNPLAGLPTRVCPVNGPDGQHPSRRRAWQVAEAHHNTTSVLPGYSFRLVIRNPPIDSPARAKGNTDEWLTLGGHVGLQPATTPKLRVLA